MSKTNEGNDQISETQTANLDLATLKSQRGAMKRNITKLKIKVEKEGYTVDYTIIKCRLQILESYFTHISHIQTQIERLDPSDEGRSDIEELFVHAKALMVDLLDKKRRSSSDDPSFLNVTTAPFTHQNRLPQLKLPHFDGKYSEYSRFISTFNTLVHEESCIPTIDKFNYLLNCLSGQALAVVKPYPVIDENYQKALDRLKDRYDNKTLIFIDHVNSLFAITPINKPNATELRSILDKVTALRSSLLSLGSEQDVMNAFIIHVVLSKIDPASKTIYDEKQDFKTLPSWDDCYNILSRRCQFLESRAKEAEGIQDNESKSKFKNSATAFVTSRILCEYCQSKEHLIGNCPSYLSLPVSRRFDSVKGSKLCINCLRKGHLVSKCLSKSRCRICHVSHHTTLHNSSYENVTQPQLPSNSSLNQTPPHQHFNRPSSSSFQYNSARPSLSSSSFNQSTFAQSTSSPNTSSSKAVIHVTTQSSPTSLSYRRSILPTAVLLIKDSFGIFQPVRALLDSCSEINLITHETVSRLRIPKIKSCQEVAGVSDIRTQLKYKVSATLKSRVNAVEFTSTFAVTKSISCLQPTQHLNIRNWNIPEGIELADPQFYVPQRIDLLLSSEIFFELILDGKLSLGDGLPQLINSSLGWIVGGKLDTIKVNQPALCNVVTTYQELDSMLKSFWEIEEFSQKPLPLTEEENQCEQHFTQNTIFDHNGRVKVRLPFKLSPNHLGNSLEMARRRFAYLEKRLLKDESLRKMYVEFMTEYIDLGHMTLVSPDALTKPHYVIPHHPVLRPQSTTTKLRVVFDASARTSTNVSSQT